MIKVKNRNVLTTIALISSSLFGCSSDPGYTVNEYEEIPSLLEYYDVPGVSIAIIEDFKIDQLLTYGVKNRATSAPVNQDTLFQAASISKSVTAVATMKMYQDGMIELDEDINNKLVSWNLEENDYTSEEKVSLRRLLSHTAGTTVHGFRGYNQNETIPTLQAILDGQTPANSPAIVVDTTPGSLFRYSGGGYVIAQQALMDLTQQPFEDLMNEILLEPLEMTSSSFNLPLSDDRMARTSAGHHIDGQNIVGDYNRYPEMSAAGLWTTPQDLAKLLIELQLSLVNQSNKVLAGEVVEEMLTSTGEPASDPVDDFYGLGFNVWKHGDEIHFGHAGVNSGFVSQMTAQKTSGAGFVVMTNGDNGAAVIEEIISLIEREKIQNSSQS